MAKDLKSKSKGKSSKTPWLAILLFLGVFAYFGWQAMGNHAVPHWENLVLEKISIIRVDWLNACFLYMSELASVGTIVSLTLITALSLLIFKEYLYIPQIILASLGARYLMAIFKEIFTRSRPSVVEPLSHLTSYSYPSGHATTAAAFYISLYLILKSQIPSKKIKNQILTIALSMIFLISFSRLYLGVHYPSDVIGGFCLGTAWALILASVFSRFKSGGSSDS
ncbi:MAG: phosphatase PAP2 family protein [Deltaproteobacteria bacterium]|nr:phosphatase PAP2 family protein [Deltaproteobacteria bacterium]